MKIMIIFKDPDYISLERKETNPIKGTFQDLIGDLRNIENAMIVSPQKVMEVKIGEKFGYITDDFLRDNEIKKGKRVFTSDYLYIKERGDITIKLNGNLVKISDALDEDKDRGLEMTGTEKIKDKGTKYLTDFKGLGKDLEYTFKKLTHKSTYKELIKGSKILNKGQDQGRSLDKLEMSLLDEYYKNVLVNLKKWGLEERNEKLERNPKPETELEKIKKTQDFYNQVQNRNVSLHTKEKVIKQLEEMGVSTPMRDRSEGNPSEYNIHKEKYAIRRNQRRSIWIFYFKERSPEEKAKDEKIKQNNIQEVTQQIKGEKAAKLAKGEVITKEDEEEYNKRLVAAGREKTAGLDEIKGTTQYMKALLGFDESYMPLKYVFIPEVDVKEFSDNDNKEKEVKEVTLVLGRPGDSIYPIQMGSPVGKIMEGVYGQIEGGLKKALKFLSNGNHDFEGGRDAY